MAKRGRGIKQQAAGPQRAAGLAVHVFTATGAVSGFLALVAAVEDNFTLMFAWLAVALVVDAVDGTFARKVDVGRTAPEFSGDLLDLVVDYITWVLVPAYALYRADLLPEPVALPAVLLILLTSALYFADTRMKTGDWYFRGFPAAWNLVVFLAFVFRPEPWITFVLVVLLSVLTFVPVAFVHPLRVTRFRGLNIAMLALSGILCAMALAWNLDPPLPVQIGLGVAGAYFLLIGLARPRTA